MEWIIIGPEGIHTCPPVIDDIANLFKEIHNNKPNIVDIRVTEEFLEKLKSMPEFVDIHNAGITRLLWKSTHTTGIPKNLKGMFHGREIYLR